MGRNVSEGEWVAQEKNKSLSKGKMIQNDGL